MKSAALNKKTKYFQLLTISLFLALGSAIAGCSDSDTVSKIDPKERPRPKPNPDKANAHFVSDSLGALINIGLFNLERTTELAIKDKNATTLITEKECQKVTSTTNGNIKAVSVITTRSCNGAKGGGLWSGSETFNLTAINGAMKSIDSSIDDYYQIESNTPRKLYSVSQTSRFTPSTNSASDSVFSVFGSTVVRIQHKDGSKIRNSEFKITIDADVKVEKTTGLISAIALKKAIAAVQREDKYEGQITTAKLVLTPESLDFSPLTCGRYVGDLAFTNTLASSNSRSTGYTLTGNLVFTENKVSYRGKEKMFTKVAACKPGFLTVQEDFMEAGNKVLNLMTAKPAESDRDADKDPSDDKTPASNLTVNE